MPVLRSPAIAPEYASVVIEFAAARGGLNGLTLICHTAYREHAMQYHRDTFRAGVNEALDAAGHTVESLAKELGNFKGNTLRLKLNGSRPCDLDLLFAMEWWIDALDDEPAYSPFAQGVIEAARVQGYCAAIQAVRDRMSGDSGRTLSHREFWQLHRMYELTGWRGTLPADPRRFAAQAAEISEDSAWEHLTILRALKQDVPPNHIEQPYELAEMRTLDAEWGAYYLTTRMCLARGADDQYVVNYPPPAQSD